MPRLIQRCLNTPLSFRSFWKFTNTESTLVFSSTYSNVAVKLEARKKVNTWLTLSRKSAGEIPVRISLPTETRKVKVAEGVWWLFSETKGFQHKRGSS